jgi:calcipressin-2
LEKNYLISPPGSPKEGWIQVEEDPPNAVTLHDDIQAALDRLARNVGQPSESEIDTGKGKVILDTTDLGGVQVIVQDCDPMKEKEEGTTENIAPEVRSSTAEIAKTPRPPTPFPEEEDQI